MGTKFCFSGEALLDLTKPKTKEYHFKSNLKIRSSLFFCLLILSCFDALVEFSKYQPLNLVRTFLRNLNEFEKYVTLVIDIILLLLFYS